MRAGGVSPRDMTHVSRIYIYIHIQNTVVYCHVHICCVHMSLHTLYQWCFNVLWYALWWFVYFPGRQWFHAVAFWRLLEATPSELKAFLTTEHLPRAFARKVMDESVTWLKLDKQTVWYIYIYIDLLLGTQWLCDFCAANSEDVFGLRCNMFAVHFPLLTF